MMNKYAAPISPRAPVRDEYVGIEPGTPVALMNNGTVKPVQMPSELIYGFTITRAKDGLVWLRRHDGGEQRMPLW